MDDIVRAALVGPLFIFIASLIDGWNSQRRSYRKGIPADKLFEAVVNVVKESELTKAQKQEVYALVDQDEDPKSKWAKSSKRQWEWDEDAEVFKK